MDQELLSGSGKKLDGIAKHLIGLLRSKYFVVILEVLLMTILTLSSFSLLVRLTDVKTIGFWVLLNSLLSFSKVADFWSAGLVTFVAEDVERGELRNASRLVSTSMLTAAIGFLAIVLLGGLSLSIFADHIPGVDDAGLVKHVAPLMCVTFWLGTVAATYQVGFLGFNRPALKLLQNVGGSLVFLILSIFLVPHYGLWGILFAQATQGFLMLGFGMLVFHGIMAKTSPLLWSRSDFKRLTQYGSKATVVGFLQLACDPLIRVLASHFGGLAAVTLIELATRMIVAVRGLIMSVGQLLIPAFARASLQDPLKTARLYGTARQVFIVVTVPVLACLLCLAPLLERLMLVTPVPEFIPMMWLLCLGWGVNIITAPAFFLLSGRRRLRPLFLNRLLMLLCVLVFGAFGGHFFGILGVTSGVTVGLALASLVIFHAAREFDAPVRVLGLRGQWLTPVVLALVTNVGYLYLDQHGYSVVIQILASALGVLATASVSLAKLPQNLLNRFGDVNPDLQNT